MKKIVYQGQKEQEKLVASLLENAFPRDERPATKDFFGSLKKEENNLFLYYDHDEFIGFAFITLYQDVAYLFFLAVTLTKRHQGNGGLILEDIKQTYQDYVILIAYEEVNPQYPNYQERVRREKFYLKHGFKDNKMKTNEFGVIYQTVFIGVHHVSFMTYLEVFKLGFGEKAVKYVKEAY